MPWKPPDPPGTAGGRRVLSFVLTCPPLAQTRPPSILYSRLGRSMNARGHQAKLLRFGACGVRGALAAGRADERAHRRPRGENPHVESSRCFERQMTPRETPITDSAPQR